MPDGAAPADTGVAQTPSLTDEEMAKLAEEEAKTEVITITGSTIERKTLTSPAPVTVLQRDAIEASGRATIGDVIQQIPAQSNGLNAAVNNGGNGSTQVNIRGLGAQRTLTLINGRRAVAGGTGANASVDLNAIPLAVIERVEVLKDGASAIYGSDAIGGVVNVITRTEYDGTDASIYTGSAEKGDGFTYDASFVTGHNADNKKGNIIFSAGIQRQDPVFASDRAFSNIDKDFDFANRVSLPGGSPTNAGGRIATNAIDVNGDGVANDSFNVCGFQTDPATGALTTKPIATCTSSAPGVYKPFTDADLYNFQPLNYLYTPSSRYNVYSAGTYKFRPNATGFFEASYLSRSSEQQLAPEPLTLAKGLVISKDSMYNPFRANVLAYNRRLIEFGNRTFEQNVGTFRIVGGLQGSVPDDVPLFKDWKWEVSYNYGRTDATQRNEGSLQLSHVANAIGPSFVDPKTGLPTCGRQGATIAGCVPLNILDPVGSIDPRAKAYSTFTGVANGYNEQQTALATAHGRLLKLPNNGDLSVAVGADFRREAGAYQPDPVTASGDTTGNAVAPTSGAYNVLEAFGEVSLVPLSDQKYVKWLELNAAVRGFRYDTFGSSATWKAGALFRTVQGIGLRGTYSTAFRAPSIANLFQGKSDSFPAAIDPCDTRQPGGTPGPITGVAAEKCAAQGVPVDAQYNTRQQRALIGGNPELTAETATVITAGAVYEPPQVKGLAFTVDYWNVDISKAITALGASAILSNCYTRGVDAYCDLVHRNPASNYAIDYVDDSTLNVGGRNTSGVDMAASYDHRFGDVGRIRQQLEAQYLIKHNIDNGFQIFQAKGYYDFGVFPSIKANYSAIWGHPSGAGGGFTVRYVGSYTECKSNTCNANHTVDAMGASVTREVPSWAQVDVFSSYAMKTPAGKTTLTIGINNLLDANPALIYVGGQGDSDGQTYDLFGRFFYARMAQSF